MSVHSKNSVTFFMAPARDYGTWKGVEESGNCCNICQFPLYESHGDNSSLSALIAYHRIKNSENDVYHGHHLFCVGPWFKRQPTCPLCRKTVVNAAAFLPRRSFSERIVLLLNRTVEAPAAQLVIAAGAGLIAEAGLLVAGAGAGAVAVAGVTVAGVVGAGLISGAGLMEVVALVAALAVAGAVGAVGAGTVGAVGAVGVGVLAAVAGAVMGAQ